MPRGYGLSEIKQPCCVMLGSDRSRISADPLAYPVRCVVGVAKQGADEVLRQGACDYGDLIPPACHHADCSDLGVGKGSADRRGQLIELSTWSTDRDDRPGTKRVTRPRYLDASELATLLAKLGETFRPIAATYAYAGLRASEALGLRWCDIDLDTGMLRVENQLGIGGQLRPLKTEASEASLAPIRLLPALQRELAAHRQRQLARNIALVRPDALVFVTATGKPQSARNVLRAVHAAAAALDLNVGRDLVGLHDLRHTLIGLAFEHGLTLPEASALARHANPRVTAQVFAGLSEKTRQTIADKLISSGFGAAARPSVPVRLASPEVLRLPEPLRSPPGAIPPGRGWLFDPKLDGYRCLVCTTAAVSSRGADAAGT